MSDITQGKSFFGHPRGLMTLFMTEMWERFSYYGMRAILILFMTTEIAQQGLGLDNVQAGAIYGLYTAGVYLLTLPGGWLADNIFGQRKAIWYGGILIMIGHALLAIPGDRIIFFAGLAFVAMGTGFLKPNISTIVGDLYPEGGARRDAGFSIFYMGINLGSLLGQTIVSYFATVNWHYGFGIAAIGMFFGLVQYKISGPKTLGDIGTIPKAKQKREETGTKSNPTAVIAISSFAVIMLVVAQMRGWVDLFTAHGVASATAYIIPGITFFYLLSIIVGGGLTTTEKKQVVVIFMLFLGAATFWAGFEQAGSTLNLFARDFTDRGFFGYVIPPGWLQNANPLFIVILAPIMGALWVKLAARNLNPNIPIKFAFGLVMMGLGFLVMVFAANAAATAAGGAAGMGWLIMTYFLHSVGELTLSPVGLSATTKLAPRAYMGQMMGIWFVGASVGNLIAGLFAGGFDSNDVTQLPDLFMSVVWLGVGAGITFIALSPWLKKWIGNID